MNKRRIIVLIIIALVIVGAVLGMNELLSYKKVSLVFKQSDVTISLYTAANKKLSSVSDNGTITLKTGQYYYVPTNQKYDASSVYFTVTGDQTVEINPQYSATYLALLLTKQKDTIHAALTAAYPTLNAGYIIGDEQLSHFGQWYSAKLIERVSGGNEPDVYRVILKNENNTWHIAVSPRLVVSIAEFPAVPADVIRQVNAPLSNAAYALLYPS